VAVKSPTWSPIYHLAALRVFRDISVLRARARACIQCSPSCKLSARANGSADALRAPVSSWLRNTEPAAAARWYLRVVCYLTPSSCVPRGCRSKGSRGMRVTRGAVAARRGAARRGAAEAEADPGGCGEGRVERDARGGRTGRAGGRGGEEARNDGAARRGAARRGEAKCGVRRPRATATMREARREVTEGR